MRLYADELERPQTWRPEIDLHCHILPTWDDGAATLDVALAMAERAAASGLKHVVATPHVGRAFKGREHAASTIKAGVEALQREIDARAIPLQIVSGAEVMIGKVDLQTRLPHEPELTYNTAARFALIEPPTLTWPSYGAQIVSMLTMRGVQAVIAHPERYANVQDNLKVLEPLVHQGALLQITASALAGSMGKALRASCLQMLRAGVVSFVASDAHKAEGELPGDVQSELISIVGEEAAWTILSVNPRRLLENKRVRPPEPDENIPKPGMMSRLLKWGR
jgi:protein-tyrosine phosphatase